MEASGEATEKRDLCPDHAGHVVQDLGRQLFGMGALVHAVLTHPVPQHTGADGGPPRPAVRLAGTASPRRRRAPFGARTDSPYDESEHVVFDWYASIDGQRVARRGLRYDVTSVTATGR